jgi:hypothetical protein
MLSSTEFEQYYNARYLSIFRFVFIRVPKTASTALLSTFARIGISIQHIHSKEERIFEILKRTQMVTGHILYRDVLPGLAGLRPIFISVLRDPVERAVSLYRQAYDQPDHPCHEEVRAGTVLEAMRREGLFFEWVFNSQCRCVSGHTNFEDVKTILQDDYFMISQIGSVDRLLRAVCKLVQAPLNSVLPENVATLGTKLDLAEQPDFDEAVKILKWLTTEDRKLISYVGDFFVSPKLKEILPQRSDVFA